MKRFFVTALILMAFTPAMADEPLKMQGMVKQEIGTIKITGISLNHQSIYVFPGDKPRLVATVTPANAFNKQVLFESADPKVAAVDEAGNVTPVAEGTALIKAVTKDGGFSAACMVEVDLKNTYGNTSGNIHNRGYVASQGRWVYFANPDDGMKLYKIKKDGTEKTKLCDDRVSWINVIGHSLYYRNESHNSMLYSININGTKRTCLNDVDKAIRYVQASGTWIYYLNQDGELYLISIGGDHRAKLGDESGINSFTLADEWVYFSKDSGIYKMKRNGGSDKEKIVSSTGCCMIWDAEALYYRIDNDAIVKRAKGEANRYKNISTQGVYNVADGWIYYRNLIKGGDTNQLSKIHTSGSSDQLLVKATNVSALFTVDDWIYYYTQPGNGPVTLFKIRTDGLKNEKIK
jgi:hypothetical protein